jgi:hypothetical protein
MSSNTEDIAFLHADLKRMVVRLMKHPVHFDYDATHVDDCKNDLLDSLNRVAHMKSLVNDLFESLTESYNECLK